MYKYAIWFWFLLLVYHSTLAVRSNCSLLPASLYSPLNKTGPELTVSHKKLFNALKCYSDLNETIENRQKRRWTLLIPGTSENIEELYGWNWIPVFNSLKWPYCTLQLPQRGMSDLQITAEYVVYALRYIFKHAKQEQQDGIRSKTKINIIGHSVGGVLPRFALRFWPDTRQFIHHLIAFCPSNHGTLTADTACYLIPCAPSLQQQRFYSNFICALNSNQETFSGISYTNILTRTDEIIFPRTSSELIEEKQVRNIYIQDLCPMRLFSGHLAIGTYDYCAYILTISALLSKSLNNITNCCKQTLMPGITIGLQEFVKQFLYVAAENARIIIEYEHKVTDEPELRCVFRTDCIIHIKQTKYNKRR